jgi:hypothetical protein
MRFVPVKTAEQQAALMLVGVRNRLIHGSASGVPTCSGATAGDGG